MMETNLDKNGMSGLILSAASHVTLEIAKLKDVTPDLEQRTLHVFAQTSGIPMYPPDMKVIGSFYYPDGASGFDLLVLGANNRVFQDPWGHAFYYQLNRMLSSSGSLILPLNVRAEERGFWTVEQLQTLFASEGEILGGGAYIRFPKAAGIPPSNSLLSWYFENYAALIIGDMANRLVGQAVHVQRLDDIFLELALNSADTIVASPRRWVQQGHVLDDMSWITGVEPTAKNPAKTLGSELCFSHQVISYLMSGLSYKAAAIRHIVFNYCTAQRPLSYVDFGGAYGQLVIELLLADNLEFNKGVCCDLNNIYLAGAYRIYRGLRDKLYNRFFISNLKMQDFRFDQKYSLISAFSTFLYVPKEQRMPALQNCWENLEHGGVLVIFEVLKSDLKNKDYAVQFTASEIDAMLGQFGDVGRISATEMQQCSREAAKENSVIRFVVKP